MLCKIPHSRRTLLERTAALLLLASLVPGLHPSSHASCQVVTVKTVSGDPAPNLAGRISYIAAPGNGATVAYEGMAERLSDVLIYDSGSGAACFQMGNVFSLAYNVALVTAAGIDVFDSAGPAAGLAVSASASGGSTWKVTVTRAGTPGNLVSTTSGAAIRIKNVRANVSTIAPALTVVVQASATATGTLSGSLRSVGYVSHVIAPGAGIGTVGSGAQGAGGTLSTAAVFSLSENFADAFRAAGFSGVAGDIVSGSTSLIFDVANTVPPGVTITFPPSLVNAGFTFSLRYGGSCSGPVQCFAIYDTITNPTGNGALAVTTAAAARTGADGSLPAIGVQIDSNSGIGAVTLRAMLGPGTAGDTNDDVNASAIPRYVPDNTAGAAPTRAIFSGTWFTVAPGVPVLSLSPPKLAFGGLLVGTGREEKVFLTNLSAQVLQIGSIALAGEDFHLDHDCPMLVAALSSCTLKVQFAPTSEVTRTGSVTVTSNAAGSPHVVSLTGEGRSLHAVPTLSSLSPPSMLVGSDWTRLVVNGSNFAPGAVVQWNGAGLGTSFVSDTQLAAGIPPADLAAPGTATITVVNPPPGGGTSNALPLTVFAGPIPAKPYLYYVPHIVTGGGFVTTLTVVDLGPGPNTISLDYVDQTGALVSADTFGVACGGTLRVQTPPRSASTAAASQWAVIGADAPLAIHVLLEQSAPGDSRPLSSVGYGACELTDTFAIPAVFEPAPAGAAIGRTIGLAMANPSPTAVTAELRLVDEHGAVIATHTLTLPSFGQVALDLQQAPAFRAALPDANFVGSITATSTAPVCALALLDNYGPFVMSPVVKKPK